MEPRSVAWPVAFDIRAIDVSGPARLGWPKALTEQVQQSNMGSALGWVMPSGAAIALGAMTLTGPVAGVGYAAAALGTPITSGQSIQASFIVLSDALNNGVTFQLRNSSTSATFTLAATAGILGTFGFSGIAGAGGPFDQLTVKLTVNQILNVAVVTKASVLA